MPNDRHARLGDAQGAEHELHDRPRVEHGGGERAARAEHGGGDAKALGAERAREARAPHAAEVDDEEVDPRRPCRARRGPAPAVPTPPRLPLMRTTVRPLRFAPGARKYIPSLVSTGGEGRDVSG